MTRNINRLDGGQYDLLVIGAALGAGGVSYARGALIRNVDEQVDDIHSAALDAIKDLKLFVTEEEVGKRSVAIKAEYSDGRKVRIFIDALTEYASKITIRVGNFGNQDESQKILSAIEKNL